MSVTTTLTLNRRQATLLSGLVAYGLLAGEPLGEEELDPAEYDDNYREAVRLGVRLNAALDRISQREAQP